MGTNYFQTIYQGFCEEHRLHHLVTRMRWFGSSTQQSSTRPSDVPRFEPLGWDGQRDGSKSLPILTNFGGNNVNQLVNMFEKSHFVGDAPLDWEILYLRWRWLFIVVLCKWDSQKTRVSIYWNAIYNIIYIHIYTYIHTYMHAYIHKYIHTYLHAYIHTYIRT